MKKGRTITAPARELPVIAEGDVVVVGGGNAGFVAAIAAARAGARTILIERYGYLAGCLTATYSTTPGFFGDSEGDRIIGGIGWEFVERMEAAGAALVDRDWWTVQIMPEAAKSVALEMILEAGVELYLHAWAADVVLREHALEGVVTESKSGRQVIAGKAFVDASGDADLAYLAGAPTELLPADQLWQTSVDLTVCNVDARRVVQWIQDNPDRTVWLSMPADLDAPGLHPMVSVIVKESGDAPAGASPALHHGPVPTIKLMLEPSISRVQGSVEINGTDVRALTWAEIEARRRALQHLAYLKATVPGYEKAVIVAESHLGVRETRRIVGDYVLTLNDLRSNARFADVVALNSRPLDRHLKGDAFQFEMFMGHHDIPLRALLPRDVDNLLVAGRAISCDHESHASLRGAATCLATGHAAGAAAALTAAGNGRARDIDIGKLQELLLEQGAILRAGA
jgi:hypothetical protein